MSDTRKSQTSEEQVRRGFFFSLYSAVCLRKETPQVSVLPEAGIPGETPHMKGVGMLVGTFELNP